MRPASGHSLYSFSPFHWPVLSCRGALPSSPQYSAVALAAEVIRLPKTDQFAVCEPEFVPVVGIMAVEAPSVRHVPQRYLLMDLLELPRFSVGRHALMTLGAWKDTGVNGGGRW